MLKMELDTRSRNEESFRDTYDIIKTRENGLDEIAGSFIEKGNNLSGFSGRKYQLKSRIPVK
ncbi:MAG: hypothetical protein ACYDEX_08825 [Mobilitalea sp.]